MSHFDLNSRQHLRELVKPLIQEATRIIPGTPFRMPAGTHLESHFGGIPYFEQGEAWPETANGKPLAFIFQVVNDGNIHLPADIKILQFYYDWESNAWDTEDDGWRVKTYQQIDTNARPIAEKPYTRRLTKFCPITFEKVNSLPDWASISEWHDDIYKLSAALNETEPWESYEDVVKELIGEQSYRSQLGGYPKWLQSDATPIDNNDNRLPLLFQLDSEAHPGLTWSDTGLVYSFYDQDNITFTLQSL